MISEIKKVIQNKNMILFVGAGLSASLGLPTWSQLIEHISEELGYEKNLFSQYGDNLALSEYYFIQNGRIGELRSWMDRNWNVEQSKIENSKIFKAIVDLNFPLIYTTNFDHCLETAYKVWNKDYHKIIGVDDLVKIKSNTTQIIKFHGDLVNDESIVLTESSYFERMDFESPLDIKLRSDMLGKSILFVGYSLSDINMRFLIYKLDKLWQKSNSSSQRPKSYLFMANPNPVQEVILQKRGIITLVGETTDKSKSMEEFLLQLLDK